MKKLLCCLCILVLGLSGCGNTKRKEDVKVGVSLGVGEATRWVEEKEYMEKHAEKIGIHIEVRLNKTDEPKTQAEDCYEMIDEGIDVLILTPRDIRKVDDIIKYAKKHDVKVINYARVVLGTKVDLFVGYDSEKIGQMMGQYLTEMVYQGDYIVLRGDVGDNNAKLLYDGSMRYINAKKEDIHIVLDASVPNWSIDEAKKLVLTALASNNNHIDAIFAPNDKLASACVEALAELGITDQVIITGMDAELDAVKRIVAGTQNMTVYLDLKELAETALNEAYHMAMGEEIHVNTEFDNESDGTIKANLVNGKIVTKQNLDSILIDSNYFTHQEVYGE